jgi:hypothetical protein
VGLSRKFLATTVQYNIKNKGRSKIFSMRLIATATNAPQTFHKRSTNVPDIYSNRNENKTFKFVPRFVLSKEIISVRSRRVDSGPNRNNKTNSGTIPKRFRFVSKTISERLSFRL